MPAGSGRVRSELQRGSSWLLLRRADGRGICRRVEGGIGVGSARCDQVHGLVDRNADEAVAAVHPGIARQHLPLRRPELTEIAGGIGLKARLGKSMRRGGHPPPHIPLVKKKKAPKREAPQKKKNKKREQDGAHPPPRRC